MIVPLVLLGLWVWAIVDVVLAPEFRHGDRWLWLIVILLGLAVGAVLYLAIGRQWDRSAPVEAPPRLPHPSRPARPLGPDDDPDFLGSL